MILMGNLPRSGLFRRYTLQS